MISKRFLPHSTMLLSLLGIPALSFAGTGQEVPQIYLHWMLFITLLIVVVVYWNRRLAAAVQTREEANHLAKSYLNIIDRYVITSRTDLQGTIVDVSQAFCDISGYRREELIGRSHGVIRHTKTEDHIYQSLWQALEQNQSWSGEMCNRRKDGTSYWVSASITADYDIRGQKIGYIAVHQDITDHRIVRELSLRDPLTGLYNRRHFNDIFAEQLEGKHHEQQHAALILLDIDHFKKFNDTYGHQKGDTALTQVALCMEEVCQTLNDTDPERQAHAFRLGGEEFALLALLNETETGEAAEAIRRKVCDLRIEHINNEAFGIMTCSLGSYSFPINRELPDEADELFRIADQALYRAKDLGRNQVQSANRKSADIELF